MMRHLRLCAISVGESLFLLGHEPAYGRDQVLLGPASSYLVMSRHTALPDRQPRTRDRLPQHTTPASSFATHQPSIQIEVFARCRRR